jgi:uncharacterized protein YunC (DUF1805 family)
MKNMTHEKVQLAGKQADGYVIPLGPVNLVMIITDSGMLGCGAFDVAVLDRFDYPAVRASSPDGSPISTIDDLLKATVKDVNTAAGRWGITAGMTGKEALGLM